MGKGDWRGEVGAPELSEQVGSSNKTYLFHLCSVCALRGSGGREPLVAGGLGNCLKDTPPWASRGRMRAPRFEGDPRNVGIQVGADDL